MQVRRHQCIPRTRFFDWRFLGKRASDQTQACQQTHYRDQTEGGTTSSRHRLSILLGSFVPTEAGEPGRDETPTGWAEDPVSGLGPQTLLVASKTRLHVQM